MDNNVEEEGISFAELCKVIFGINKKRRILFLILFAIITILAVLGIKFGYNRVKNEYVSSFNYSVSAFDEETYLDGTKFNYNDLISYNSLISVKNSKDEYKSIDIEKLYDNDAISITKLTEENPKYRYTLTIKSKYFSSFNQAKLFVNDLISIPVNKTNDIILELDNTNYLKSYSTATTYDEIISSFSSQANYILSEYDRLIDTYNDLAVNTNVSSVFNDTKVSKISDYKNYAQSEINLLVIDTLSSEVKKNNYVYKYDENISILNSKKMDIENNLALVNTKIDKIRTEIDRQGTTSQIIVGLNNELATLLVEQADYESQLDIITKQIENGKNANTTMFDDKLKNVYDSLLNLTNVEKDVYTKNQNIYYQTNNVIKKQGGFSTPVAILVSIVGGILVAGVVNLCLDHKYLSHKEELNN